MELIVVGDVHGKFADFQQLLCDAQRAYPDAYVVQVGDLGIGFEFTDDEAMLRNTALPFGFIAGNHDNPFACAQDEHWLGKWGTLPFVFGDKTAFFVGGAYSIDQHSRIEGYNWWRDEELSIAELTAALDAYAELQPELVITHDCPLVGAPSHVQRNLHPNRTQQALDAMWAAWQPKLWLYGHHHESIRRSVDGTRFVCLRELETYTVTSNIDY